MKIVTTVLGTALMLGFALPVAAQMPPPPADMAGDHGGPKGMHHDMFGSMSEPGRKRMMEAMRAADPRDDHSATKAARDRILAILDADRLDVPALKRAMDDERETTNAAKIKHQAAFLAAFQQLSLADRKAFVADARQLRARMDARMKDHKGGRMGGMGGMDMPPPPPPM